MYVSLYLIYPGKLCDRQQTYIKKKKKKYTALYFINFQYNL